MENFLPFTDDVMVVLVHKCVQQTHLLALHLETLGYIPRLLNALNGLVYFLIMGDPRGDNLMVGSISRKLESLLFLFGSKRSLSDIGHGYYATVCMPVCIPNQVCNYYFLFNSTRMGQV